MMSLLLLLTNEGQSQSCHPVTLTVTRASGSPATRQPDGSLRPTYPLSNVNVANVQGALKYVQTETIDLETGYDTAKCQRKNGVAFIHFYALTVCNPDATLKAFGSTQPEYGPYLAFDQGACHADVEHCQRLGAQDKGGFGPFVGVQPQEQDPRGPYPGALWYSLPGHCPTRQWSEKQTAGSSCNTTTSTGKCPPGQVPDGIQCTWSTRFLGQVKLDELVGITKIQNPKTSRPYGSAEEFCLAGEVEFARHNVTYDLEQGLGFWHDPINPIRNTMRINALVAQYRKNPENQPLPTPASLVAKNPRCYENVRHCGNPVEVKDTYICERDASQRCQVCFECTRGGEHLPHDWQVHRLSSL